MFQCYIHELAVTLWICRGRFFVWFAMYILTGKHSQMYVRAIYAILVQFYIGTCVKI